MEPVTITIAASTATATEAATAVTAAAATGGFKAAMMTAVRFGAYGIIAAVAIYGTYRVYKYIRTPGNKVVSGGAALKARVLAFRQKKDAAQAAA